MQKMRLQGSRAIEADSCAKCGRCRPNDGCRKAKLARARTYAARIRDMVFGELKKELHAHVERRFDETLELVNEYARNRPVELNRETSTEVDNGRSELQEVFDLYMSADCSSLARKNNLMGCGLWNVTVGLSVRIDSG